MKIYSYVRSGSGPFSDAGCQNTAHMNVPPKNNCQNFSFLLSSSSKPTPSPSTSKLSSSIYERSPMARFLSRQRSMEEWYTRMAVENGFSFNQMATSEFVFLGFSNLGMKAKKSRSWISASVNTFISKLQQEVKAKLKEDFDCGRRFSVVLDEWTSISNHRYLNVCIVTDSDCTNLGLARCHGSMTATRTAELVEVKNLFLNYCGNVPKKHN